MKVKVKEFFVLSGVVAMVALGLCGAVTGLYFFMYGVRMAWF